MDCKQAAQVVPLVSVAALPVGESEPKDSHRVRRGPVPFAVIARGFMRASLHKLA